LKVDFQEADFIDNGHFSPGGNRKFAEALAGDLKLK
jgi:lysophospholipase L1-like esterase